MLVRVLLGVVVGLLLAWFALLIALALSRPKGASLREAGRLLTDVLVPRH